MTVTSAPSATTWGSPTAAKHALLIHGLTSSSHTWHRVASSLAAQGYFVTAPNLLGHASRTSTDYSPRAVIHDLGPYLDARPYALVVGHSWGATIALTLIPYLSSQNPTAIVLVDPPMLQTDQKLEWLDALLSDACLAVTPAETYATDHPTWTSQDCIYRELGTRLCSVDAIHAIIQENRPWNFLHYLDEVPDKCKVTAVVADPTLSACDVDLRPCSNIRVVTVQGAGHWIQYEFPEVIIEEALKRVAELDID